MNSYGSVSRVSESIYKMLRYMKWISSNDEDADAKNVDANSVNSPVELLCKGEKCNNTSNKYWSCVSEPKVNRVLSAAPCWWNILPASVKGRSEEYRR